MTELFSNAAEIMLVGMGAVLAFLLILIGVISLMGRFIPQPQSVPQRRSPAAKSSAKGTDSVSPNVIAAIGAAVHRYRKTNQK